VKNSATEHAFYRPPELQRIKNAVRASVATFSSQIQARTPARGPRSAEPKAAAPSLKSKMRALRKSTGRRFSSAFTPSPVSAQDSPSSQPFLQSRISRRRGTSIRPGNASAKTYSFLSYYKSELPGRDNPPPVPDLPRELYLHIHGKGTSNELGQKTERDVEEQRDVEDIPFNDTGTVRIFFLHENGLLVTVSIHFR
jgi:hypothetical protein